MGPESTESGEESSAESYMEMGWDMDKSTTDEGIEGDMVGGRQKEDEVLEGNVGMGTSGGLWLCMGGRGNSLAVGVAKTSR